MSTSAEDVSGVLSSKEENLDNVDQIADLLTGGASEEEEQVEEETQLQDSTETEDDTEEEGEANDDEEDTTLEVVADDDPTWEGVLGVNPEQLSFDEDGELTGVNVKVNGEVETVDMTTLIAGFQNNKANTQKSQAHAEAVKAFDVQKQELEQAYTSKLESVDALTKHFEKQLISEYDGMDWDKLRVEDPAEYAAARHDFATKAGELKSIMEAISQDKEAHIQENLQATQAKQAEFAKAQYDLMIQNNPEWSDEATLKTAHDSFQNFVKEQYGFNDDEWAFVTDARLVELIKDAKKYHDGAKVAAKKTQKPVPKFQKSKGGGAKKPQSKLAKLTSAAKKAKGANKRDLQTSAVAELLTGG